MFTFIFINCFLLFVGASRSLILFEFIIKRIPHLVDQMVLSIAEVRTDTIGYYFTVVIELSLAFDQAIRLFVLSKQLHSHFPIV